MDSLYRDSLFAAWVLLSFFGTRLLFLKIEGNNLALYNRSSRLLGLAMFAFAIEIFLQWLFDFRSWAPCIATALVLTCFYLAAILYGMSFISLIDRHYINRKRLYGQFLRCAVCIITVWCAVMVNNIKLQTYMQVTVAVIFAIEASHISYLFFKTYQKAKKEVENYYSDNIGLFVKWLYRSTFAIITYGLACAVLAFASKALISIYMTTGIFVFIYIYISFANYMVHVDKVEVALEVSEKTSDEIHNEMAYPKESEEIIRNKVESWVREKNYLKQGITISQMVEELGSNRQYLSSFINTEYKCTFREWICHLKIEEAMRLMLGNSSVIAAKAAEEVGFANDSHFNRQFKKFIGMTPTEWRRQNVI